MIKQNTAIKEQEKHVVNFESLPLGQRLRRLGYRVIVDLSNELNCEKLGIVETEKEVKKAMNDLKHKHPNSNISTEPCTGYRRVFSYVFFRCFDTEVCYIWNQRSTPKITELENYIHDDIPTHLFDKVEKAKKDGLKDFFVAYPVIEKTIQTDPIIFSKLGDEMIFIGQWE